MKDKKLVLDHLYQMMLEKNREMIQLRTLYWGINDGRYDEMEVPIKFVAEHDFHYSNLKH